MKLDITSLLAGRKKSLDFSYELDPADDRFPIPPDGVAPTSNILVSGKISDSGSCLSLTVTAKMDYTAPCDRCADTVNTSVLVTLERIIAGAGVINAEDGGDYIIEENGIIDFDLDLFEEVMLGFPSQLLCRPDCKGICPKCGCNFNYEACKCSEEREIDPRWQVLSKLLENNEEK